MDEDWIVDACLVIGFAMVVLMVGLLVAGLLGLLPEAPHGYR